jgi:hypothetical protein
MNITLSIIENPTISLTAREYSKQLDTVASIFSDVCDELEGQGQFHASGFGQDRWPMQIHYDLVVLLEQLPSVIRAVQSGIASEIDFCGQGVERKLYIEPAADQWEISCASYGQWTPSRIVELMTQASLLHVLFAVRDEFVRALSQSAPKLLEREFVIEWLSGCR